MKTQDDIFALCDQIRETSFSLHRYLRHGHLEKVYENGLAHRLRKTGLTVEQQYPLQVFDEDRTVLGDYLLISEDGANLLARITPIAFSISGKIWVNNHAHILRFDNRSTQIFVECYINKINLDDYITGSAQPKLSQQNLNRIEFPLPPLKTQQKIVAKIESERELVDANKKLIEIFEKKIKDKIGEVWGE